MAKTVTKTQREPFFHVVKRDDMPWWKAWTIRAATIVIAFLLVGVLSMTVTERNFGETYGIMLQGVFGRLFEGRTTMLWKYLQEIAILLSLALALTPAFKMKFWNCGAEGQALVGGLASIICMIELGPKLPYPVLITVIALTSILAGAIWGIIPAIFKALFNTNETLFTLMMNYVAIQLTSYFVSIWENPKGSNSVGLINMGTKGGWFPEVFGQQYMLNVIIVLAVTIAMFVYLKWSKPGYEIAVVGESVNTAKYAGIKVSKVIIRTMAISGAVCGIAGFVTVAGSSHTISTNVAGGRGFTAIIVAWLAKFNTFVMILISFLLIFLDQGASEIASKYDLNDYTSKMLTGIILFFILGSEFFINYKLNFRHKEKAGKEDK